MHNPYSVKTWLAKYKSLKKDEIEAFAREIYQKDTIIDEIFQILNNPRHQEFDPIYHQLYDFYRSDNYKLQLFTVQFIPTLIHSYLKEHSLLKGYEFEIFTKLESFLLSLYNLSIATGKLKSTTNGDDICELFFPLNYPSIYHDPQFYPISSILEFTRSDTGPLNSNSVTVSSLGNYIGSSQSSEYLTFEQSLATEPLAFVNSENRYKFLTALLYVYNQFLAELPLRSLKLTCLIITSQCSDHFSKDVKLEHRKYSLINSLGLPHISGPDNRLCLPENILVQYLRTVFFGLYNGASELALDALEAINNRSIYFLLPKVQLLVSCIRNSIVAPAATLSQILRGHSALPSRFDLDDVTSVKPLSASELNKVLSARGIQVDHTSPDLISEAVLRENAELLQRLSLNSPLALYLSCVPLTRASKNAITNATFKLQKLPEDISPLLPPVTAGHHKNAESPTPAIKDEISPDKKAHQHHGPLSPVASPITAKLFKDVFHNMGSNPTSSTVQPSSGGGGGGGLSHDTMAAFTSFLPQGAAKFWSKAFSSLSNPIPVSHTVPESGGVGGMGRPIEKSGESIPKEKNVPLENIELQEFPHTATSPSQLDRTLLEKPTSVTHHHHEAKRSFSTAIIPKHVLGTGAINLTTSHPTSRVSSHKNIYDSDDETAMHVMKSYPKSQSISGHPSEVKTQHMKNSIKYEPAENTHTSATALHNKENVMAAIGPIGSSEINAKTTSNVKIKRKLEQVKSKLLKEFHPNNKKIMDAEKHMRTKQQHSKDDLETKDKFERGQELFDADDQHTCYHSDFDGDIEETQLQNNETQIDKGSKSPKLRFKKKKKKSKLKLKQGASSSVDVLGSDEDEAGELLPSKVSAFTDKFLRELKEGFQSTTNTAANKENDIRTLSPSLLPKEKKKRYGAGSAADMIKKISRDKTSKKQHAIQNKIEKDPDLEGFEPWLDIFHEGKLEMPNIKPSLPPLSPNPQQQQQLISETKDSINKSPKVDKKHAKLKKFKSALSGLETSQHNLSSEYEDDQVQGPINKQKKETIKSDMTNKVNDLSKLLRKKLAVNTLSNKNVDHDLNELKEESKNVSANQEIANITDLDKAIGKQMEQPSIKPIISDDDESEKLNKEHLALPKSDTESSGKKYKISKTSEKSSSKDQATRENTVKLNNEPTSGIPSHENSKIIPTETTLSNNVKPDLFGSPEERKAATRKIKLFFDNALANVKEEFEKLDDGLDKKRQKNILSIESEPEDMLTTASTTDDKQHSTDKKDKLKKFKIKKKKPKLLDIYSGSKAKRHSHALVSPGLNQNTEKAKPLHPVLPANNINERNADIESYHSSFSDSSQELESDQDGKSEIIDDHKTHDYSTLLAKIKKTSLTENPVSHFDTTSIEQGTLQKENHTMFPNKNVELSDRPSAISYHTTASASNLANAIDEKLNETHSKEGLDDEDDTFISDKFNQLQKLQKMKTAATISADIRSRATSNTSQSEQVSNKFMVKKDSIGTGTMAPLKQLSTDLGNLLKHKFSIKDMDKTDVDSPIPTTVISQNFPLHDSSQNIDESLTNTHEIRSDLNTHSNGAKSQHLEPNEQLDSQSLPAEEPNEVKL